MQSGRTSKELDEDEEKGQCVYYSLCDTEEEKSQQMIFSGIT